MESDSVGCGIGARVVEWADATSGAEEMSSGVGVELQYKTKGRVYQTETGS